MPSHAKVEKGVLSPFFFPISFFQSYLLSLLFILKRFDSVGPFLIYKESGVIAYLCSDTQHTFGNSQRQPRSQMLNIFQMV